VARRRLLRHRPEVENELKKSGSPLNRILLPEELKKLGAIPEAAMMLEAASGFSFDEALTGPEIRQGEANYRGTHGYLPTRAEMRASLIVYGANVRVGTRVALAKMLDIAPTAAALLGLSFENAEGVPLREVLRADSIPKSAPNKNKKSGRQ
jgi:predicted AlkP superfamily pyrophosphatase or phosphodiesterase